MHAGIYVLHILILASASAIPANKTLLPEKPQTSLANQTTAANQTAANQTAANHQTASTAPKPHDNHTQPANPTTQNATRNETRESLDDATPPSNGTDPDSEEDDWMESKASFSSRLAKMWHCVTDDYREPTFSDVRFFLFTRNNRHQSEELNLTLTNVIREQIHQLGVNPLRQVPFAADAGRRSYRDAGAKFTPLPPGSPVRSKYFNVEAPTKFIIHGYTESSRERKMVLIKRAYLCVGDYNVVMVDWHALAKPPCYVNAVRYTKFVGYALAILVDQLHLGDVDLGSLHMVGFSLGAHIAGYAGSKVVRGNVFRITGLDPALPLYMTDDPLEKLDRTDARFVDVIHTNAGVLGQNGPTGHADFYPNGGTFQPGCDISDVFCSHKRAAELFVESIGSARFVGVACASYKDFKANACNGTEGTAVMGDLAAGASGAFYLYTNGTSPYALG